VSDAAALRSFVLKALADLGASVSEGGSLVWVQAPVALRSDLDVPATFAITFDPARAGDFDAELVAPGSYFLERIVSLAVRRGRWDVARYVPPAEWVPGALSGSGLDPDSGVRGDVLRIEDTVLIVLSFRVTLLSDEKREALHMIAVSPATGAAWELDPGFPTSDLIATPEATIPLNLEEAYRIATQVLREKSRASVDRFRAASLRLLEEEVRRIFGYFDRTRDEIQGADPAGSDDLVRALDEERDRRLSETLERFDPRAKASLCSIRAVLTPTAHVRLRLPGGAPEDVTLDAWSRHVAGLVCPVCHRTEGPWHLREGFGVRCAQCV
jgi:hypothetical protein